MPDKSKKPGYPAFSKIEQTEYQMTITKIRNEHSVIEKRGVACIAGITMNVVEIV